MITIKKGNYKNLSITINHEGQIIIKSPKYLKDKEIEKFYLSKKGWIDKHTRYLETQNKIKSNYDFNHFVYLYTNKFKGIKSKEESHIIYKEIFNKGIIPLVVKLANYYGFKKPINIKPMKSKRIWGSLSNKNEMKLNILISILPKILTEYIIIHELCHSKEFNHSPQFWNLVQSIMPNYKIIKKKLGDYSFILRSNIL